MPAVSSFWLIVASGYFTSILFAPAIKETISSRTSRCCPRSRRIATRSWLRCRVRPAAP